MRVLKPDYYDQFHCIAGECPDSCCKEWDVQVDGETARLYRSLGGKLGEALRSVLADSEGEAYLTMVGGRCPMWREDGLCRVQAEMGEAGLCRVCREFPRLRHDYGNFQELGLELSCPEAARLILSASAARLTEEQAPGGGDGAYDREAMGILLRSRERVLEIFSSEARPVGESLALGMLYGYQVQGELEGEEERPFEESLEGIRGLARPGDLEGIFSVFQKLEILTPEWAELLKKPAAGSWGKEHLALARYLTLRYWLQAVADRDLYSRVKFIILACLVVKHLPVGVQRGAQLFSKEIENDADNVDALLDGAYTESAFRDDGLLGLLLGVRQ